MRPVLRSVGALGPPTLQIANYDNEKSSYFMRVIYS